MKKFRFRNEHNAAGKILFGIFMLAAGSLMIAFNNAWLPSMYEQYVFSMPTLFIALGLINIVSRRHVFIGLVFSVLGTFSLLADIYNVPLDYSDFIVPTALMGFGALILSRNFLHAHYRKLHNKKSFIN